MARSLVFPISRSEVGAVVGGVEDQRIPGQAQAFLLADSSEVRVQAVDASQVIGEVLAPVALCAHKVAGDSIILKPFLRSTRALIALVVVLMVRFDIRNEQEERLFGSSGTQIRDGKVREAVNAIPILRELDLFHGRVEHVAVVTVRRELQHVGCQPVVFVTAPPFGGNGSASIAVLPVLWAEGSKVPLPDITHLVSGLGKMTRNRLF